MSDRTTQFSKELDDLIEQGNQLGHALEYECNRQAYKNVQSKSGNFTEEQLERFLENLPNFRVEYQKWYSKSYAVIRQLLPDRLKDFVSHYEYPRVRKSIDFQNYMIRDYLQGLMVTRTYHDDVGGDAAIPEFRQQIYIIKAARDSLDSKLMDFTAVLQADLFDSEIETASSLAKAGHLRAAGAICGVVIEKHLTHIADVHNVKVTKKHPGISDLALLLRTSDIITMAKDRFIQSLADTRNLCSHAKGREPTKDEIDELVEGTQKVLKTVF